MSICEICSKNFINKRNLNSKICSRSCNAIHATRIRQKRLLEAKAGRHCLHCGKELNHRQTKFCSLSCAKKSSWGSGNPMWRGGRKKHSEGYVYRYCPTHPQNTYGYVLEHRLVMEGLLDRRLEKHEIVHHLNGIKNDNRPDNLELIGSQGEHILKHHVFTDGWYGRHKESLSSQDKKAVNSVEPSQETIPS